MWRCEACGRSFANRNQTHTCAALRALETHFEKCEPHVRATFDALLRAVEEIGPAIVMPQKTRIALQVRMSFAALMPRRQWLDGHLVLARRVESPCFSHIETISPRNHVHRFRLRAPADVTAGFAALVAEAYAVGEQRHLAR